MKTRAKLQKARHSRNLMLVLLIALAQLTQLAESQVDCSGTNTSQADSIYMANEDIVPTLIYVHPGSVATATFTDGEYLYPRIRNSMAAGFKSLTPIECFTGIQWELVEQGTQDLTTAYGSNPITFLPTTEFPTSFQVADLGTSVPDGQYEFNLKVTETDYGISTTDSTSIYIQKCSDMASVSLSPTIADFTVYWKGLNSDNTFSSALTAVASNASSGIVDATCYTVGSFTLTNTDGNVDSYCYDDPAIYLKSDNSGLKVKSLSAEVPLGTYSYSISVSVTENGSGTTHTGTTTFQMTVGCPNPTLNTFTIDQSVATPELLNKGANSDISLNGGSAMTATVQITGTDVPRPDCAVITWSVAEDSTTLESQFGGTAISIDSTSAPKVLQIADLQNRVIDGDYTFTITATNTVDSTTATTSFTIRVLPRCIPISQTCSGSYTHDFTTTGLTSIVQSYGSLPGSHCSIASVTCQSLTSSPNLCLASVAPVNEYQCIDSSLCTTAAASVAFDTGTLTPAQTNPNSITLQIDTYRPSDLQMSTFSESRQVTIKFITNDGEEFECINIITLNDPCTASALTSMTTASSFPFTTVFSDYNLNQPDMLLWQWNTWSEQTRQPWGNWLALVDVSWGNAYCGDYSINIEQLKDVTNPYNTNSIEAIDTGMVSYDSSAYTLTKTFDCDESHQSTWGFFYSINIAHSRCSSGTCSTARSTSYSQLKVELVLRDCPYADSLTYPSGGATLPTSLEYILTDTLISVTYDEFDALPCDCNVYYSMTLSEPSLIIRHEVRAARTIDIESLAEIMDLVPTTDPAQITIEVTVNANVGLTITSLPSFYVTLKSPCINDTFNRIILPTEMPLFNYTVGQGEMRLPYPTTGFTTSMKMCLPLVASPKNDYDRGLVELTPNDIVVQTYDYLYVDTIQEIKFYVYMEDYDDYKSLYEEYIYQLNITGIIPVDTSQQDFLDSSTAYFGIVGDKPDPFEFNILDPNGNFDVALGPLLYPNKENIEMQVVQSAPAIRIEQSLDLSYELKVNRLEAEKGSYKIKIKVTGYDSDGYSSITLFQFRVALKEEAVFSIVIKLEDGDDDDKSQDYPEYDGCESVNDPGDSFYKAQQVPYNAKLLPNGKLTIKLPKIRYQDEKEDEKFVAGCRWQTWNKLDKRKVLNTETQPAVDGLVYGVNLSEEIEVPGIRLSIEPTGWTESRKLNFYYEVESFSEDELSLQITFENPGEISTAPQPEKEVLVIEMFDLRDPQSKLIVEDHTIRKQIQPQVDPGLGAALQSAGGTAAFGLGANMSFNFVLNILMSSSINAMLGSIKPLQIIVHLCLLNVILPGNANIFYAAISEMIAFDPLPVPEVVYEIYLSELEMEEELPGNFQQLGYETYSILANMGSLVLILLAQLLLVLVFVVLFYCPHCMEKVKDSAGRKIDSIFFNAILAFIDGTFLVIVLMAMINIDSVLKGNDEENISYYTALIFCFLIALQYIGVFLFFAVNRKSLNSESNKKCCGYIYEELNFNVRGNMALAFPLLAQLRLAVIIYTIMYLAEHLVLQCLIVSITSVFISALLGFDHPYGQISKNFKSIVSEAYVLIVLDLLLFSSNPTTTVYERSLYGWGMIGVVGIQIFTSQGSLFIQSLKKGCRGLKLKFLRKKYQRIMQARQKKQLAENKIKSQNAELSDSKVRGNKRRKQIVIKSWQRSDAKDRRKEFGESIVTPVMISVSGAPVLPAIQELQEEFNDEEQQLEEQCPGCRLRTDNTKCILCRLEDDKFGISKASISGLDISEEEIKSARQVNQGTDRGISHRPRSGSDSSIL